MTSQPHGHSRLAHSRCRVLCYSQIHTKCPPSYPTSHPDRTRRPLSTPLRSKMHVQFLQGLMGVDDEEDEEEDFGEDDDDDDDDEEEEEADDDDDGA